MADKEQLVEILRVEGIMAQGYGLNPKLVMRDKRLTPEAKCIYAYFSSFAGAGNQAFPSRALMLEELGMSVKRYYSHLKLLLEYDYIRIEKTRAEGNRFAKNIYTIVALPNPKEEVRVEEQIPAKKERVQSAGKRRGETITLKALKSTSALRTQLDVDVLKGQMPEHQNLIEDIFMATEDMAVSEQINIGGSIKKRDAIELILSKLNADHIRFVVHRIASNKSKITNKKAYLQACVCNSIFDTKEINQDMESVGKAEEIKQREEERADIERRTLEQKQYENFPELKEIDNELLKLQSDIAKVILSDNRVALQKLRAQSQELLDKKEKLMRFHNLQEYR